MTEARPKPLVGALLGGLLGLLVMALLWILGVMPPDRLPLFGLLALGIGLGVWLGAQRLSAARGRTISMIVLASLLGGVALTGIPETANGGSLSQGCTLEGTSSLESDPVAVADTSAFDPFDVTTTDTIEWSGSTGTEVAEASVDVSLMVGGFAIPIDSATMTNPAPVGQWSGSAEVAPFLQDIEDASAMLLTGTYHVSATIDAADGQCEGDGYLRVQPEGTFSGLLLALLWAVLAIVLIALVVVAITVRRSFSQVDAERRTLGEAPPSESLGTSGSAEPSTTPGATAAGAGAGAAATQRETDARAGATEAADVDGARQSADAPPQEDADAATGDGSPAATDGAVTEEAAQDDGAATTTPSAGDDAAPTTAGEDADSTPEAESEQDEPQGDGFETDEGEDPRI